MEYRPCWFVQSLDDGSFLAPDGEGGVLTVLLLVDAVAFDIEESAINAAVDHFDGRASVVQFFHLISCI